MKLCSPVQRMIGLAGLVCVMACLGFTQDQQTPPSAPQTPPSKPADATKMPSFVYVLMSTSKGDIVLELNHDKAPISVNNFLSYTEKGFYDGTIFHRVMGAENFRDANGPRDFMIQGGGFTPDMKQKQTDPPIQNEYRNGLKNERGTIAMARLGGQPNSATSQFFINLVHNVDLDGPKFDQAGYAVFGKVVAGMSVVDKIKAVETHMKDRHSNVPVQPITINKVKRITDEEAKKLIEADKPAAS